MGRKKNDGKGKKLSVEGSVAVMELHDVLS